MQKFGEIFTKGNKMKNLTEIFKKKIEMLKAAGTAYVMATGHPLAKKAADYVVESPLPVMQGLL